MPVKDKKPLSKAKRRAKLPVRASQEAIDEVTPLLHRGAGRLISSKQSRLHARLMDGADSEPARIGAGGPANGQAKKSTPAPRRSRNQFLADEERVARFHAQGMNKEAIGEALGLTPCQVKEHCDNLSGYFKKLAGVSAQELRGRQLCRLDFLWGECQEGIKQSKQPAKKRTVEAIRGVGGGGPVAGRSGKVVEISQERIVDFGIMQIATNVLTREAKLMGLDAPVEVKQIYEEREQGVKDIMEAIARHTTPEQARKIAESLTLIVGGDSETEVETEPSE